MDANRSSRNRARWLIGAGVVCATYACQRVSSPVLPKDDVILAKVNDSPISQYDIDRLAQHTLGDLGGETVRRSAQGKLLETLLRSRAMAALAESELSVNDRLALEKDVASYREQLLVRRYLDQHSKPAPITPQLITAYYQNHPERFGGKLKRRYEILGAARDLTPDERARAMKALREAEGVSDWSAWAGEQAKKGLPFTLTVTDSEDQALHGKLVELVRALKAEAPLQVVLIQGRPFVARLSGEERAAPRPLSEVRAEIERTLTPVQLSSALEKAGADVLKRVRVELLPAGKAAGGSELAKAGETQP